MKYEIKESIFDVDLDDKKILLDTESGKYFELNSTSRAIFDLIKNEPKTAKEVIKLISENFSINDTGVETEISDHLENTFYYKKAD